MNYFKSCSFFFLMFSFSLIACKKEKTEPNQFLWVDQQRVTCQGFIEQTCYLIQEGETLGTDWELFYDPIEGFDEQYEEGFIYRIEVAVAQIENPPQDASSLKYKLVKIISKE